MYDKIMALARGYLGDIDESRYSQETLNTIMNGALLRVGTDTGVEFDFDAGTNTISPVPGLTQANLIGTDIARLTLIGEYNVGALDGNGIQWKSGLSTINLAGMDRAMQNAVKLLAEAYAHYLNEIRMGNAVAETIDTYVNDVADLVGVN